MMTSQMLNVCPGERRKEDMTLARIMILSVPLLMYFRADLAHIAVA
jgi:hypothetical protein